LFATSNTPPGEPVVALQMADIAKAKVIASAVAQMRVMAPFILHNVKNKIHPSASIQTSGYSI
jgi:hypothetical protein